MIILQKGACNDMYYLVRPWTSRDTFLVLR